MKRFSCLVAVLLVLLILPGRAWAAELPEVKYLTMEQQQEIVRQLKVVGIGGLPHVPAYNPAKLQVACPLPLYVYTEAGFKQDGQFWPLLFEGQPVFFVFDYDNSCTVNATIYDWLLQAGAAVDKPFALVWDRKNAYFYDGANWLLLCTFAHQRPDYAVLDMSQPLDTSALALTDLRPVQSLADAYFERWPGEEPVAVYLADEERATGLLIKGRTFLPLRDVCKLFDVPVEYDEATRQITLHKRQDVYTLRLNDCQVSCNGQQLSPMDTPPQERDGVTYLPMRYLGELLQLSVQWDEAARRVDLQPDEIPS